ncbi:uncharacterized protein TRIADDRAFT_57348 [Trichoplax adhaerens]|uniref:DDB1- and CUL4-associated factor 17 n=1 Tax=Trichoplax adhaerens TaxID=10228 RepID=B3RZ70_TRIAD|nr:hypothetical protein TRIADDRAFT_57348 [Trichoplax adhaerens]EDV24151.1 hypothetical protein TRIADDRAFT_57348 [Trichoplax adhaerens]|eukprot:XP_002113677.1 hypothetical protein TRIADDRAFT_57348 [Trichoplax adhaerens]
MNEKLKKHLNVSLYVIRRQLYGSNCRLACKMLTSVITSPRNNFKKVATLKASSPFSYERILFNDSYRKAYDWKLCWETENKRVVIKSARNQATGSSIFMHLIILEIGPIKLVSRLKIDKQVFGHNITNVNICESMLIVRHRSLVTTYYDFNKIIEMNATEVVLLGDRLNNEIVGKFPLGIPITTVIETLETLFQLKTSEDHTVTFGGIPWHYVNRTPNMKLYQYEVRSFCYNKLAENGIFYTKNIQLYNDCAYFSFNDHLLHVESDRATFYKVHHFPMNDHNELVECGKINMKQILNVEAPQVSHTTSSGRTIKQVYHLGAVNFNENDEALLMIDYEDELEVVVTLSCKGVVYLHDWDTFEIVKEITLSNWNEDADNSVLIDRDRMIHTSKVNTNFTANLYQI